MRLIKFIIIVLSSCLMLTSCFSTKYVNAGRYLSNQYVGASEEDVRFGYGEPNNIYESQRGSFSYEYVVLVNGKGYYRNYNGKTRFTFDKEGFVRNVTTDETMKRKRFSVGKTIFLVLGVPVLLGIVAGIAAASAD